MNVSLRGRGRHAHTVQNPRGSTYRGTEGAKHYYVYVVGHPGRDRSHVDIFQRRDSGLERQRTLGAAPLVHNSDARLHGAGPIELGLCVFEYDSQQVHVRCTIF